MQRKTEPAQPLDAKLAVSYKIIERRGARYLTWRSSVNDLLYLTLTLSTFRGVVFFLFAARE